MPDENISEEDLDKIMKDIEQEEEEAAREEQAPVAKAERLSVVSGGESVRAPLEEEYTPSSDAHASDAVQTLSLELTGTINLKLCFKTGDRSIEVLCSEEALVCRMADGTEFRIPTAAVIAKKYRAA